MEPRTRGRSSRRWQTREKVFAACRIPRLSLTSSFFATAGHPKNTSTHILLWLLITANFVKLEPLGTKSTPFPLSLSCSPALPGAGQEGVLSLRTWALRGQFPKIWASACWDVSPRWSALLLVTAEGANGCSGEAWQGPGRQPCYCPGQAFLGRPPPPLTIAWGRAGLKPEFGAAIPLPSRPLCVLNFSSLFPPVLARG